jgi:hypothetical protein
MLDTPAEGFGRLIYIFIVLKFKSQTIIFPSAVPTAHKQSLISIAVIIFVLTKIFYKP